MNFSIPDPTPPTNVPPPLFVDFDTEIDTLLRAPDARTNFNVDGSGLTVAVLDTGLRVTHKCFAGRVVASKNFVPDKNQDPNDVTDFNGHGTNVTGIIAAGTHDERRGKTVRKVIAVVIAAGNDYKLFEQEGMSVPAIFREVDFR